MNEMDRLSVRIDCLRIAVEFGTQRDILDPSLLADKYYEWVMQGSGKSRPADNRKDDGLKQSQNARSVRKVG